MNESVTSSSSSSISEKVKWRIQSFKSKAFSEKVPNTSPVGTPMKYFKKYFPEELYELASSCTNEYYMENTGKMLKTSSIELKIFFGIHVIIGFVLYCIVLNFLVSECIEVLSFDMTLFQR